jgi:tetratricopeptide (TPR) repeat protein
LGSSSYQAQNHAQAITLYESGKHAINRHNLDEGKRQLQRAIERRSDVIPLGDAFFQLVMIQLARREDHRQVLRRGLEQVPDDIYLIALETAMRRLNGIDQAIYKPGAEYGAKADTALGFIYRTLGYQAETDQQYARATKAYLAGLDCSFSHDRIRSYLLRAIHHWSRTGLPIGDVERQLLRARLTRGIPGAHSGDYARLGLDLGAWDLTGLSALAYRRALEVDADNLIARTNLGWALYQQRSYSAAIDQFRRVLDRGPNSVAAFNLGLTHLANGDARHGEALYAEAVKQYGAAEARRIGAVEDLRQLVGRGGHPVAEKVLVTYWPELE